MKEKDVIDLIQRRAVPHATSKLELIETHISWVLLGDQHAYKIKKPVNLTFLDFSSPELRHHFLEKEYSLNRRLAPSMYLGILPIEKKDDGYAIVIHSNSSSDHCLWMKRMNNDLQMDLLLSKGEVDKSHIKAIVDILAPFHKNALRAEEEDDAQELWEEFKDVGNVLPFLRKQLPLEEIAPISEAISFTKDLLVSWSTLLTQRHLDGFVIDGHGDLHTRNILLEDPPVIFDCIEFNEEFRLLDILCEIAFLTMDLERYGRHDLSSYLMEEYQKQYPIIRNKQEENLYLFYKLHRAGIQIKVKAITAQQRLEEGEPITEQIDLIRDFLRLFSSYLEELKARSS
jgi:aminoglycoside phosphotransferase family enzyme